MFNFVSTVCFIFYFKLNLYFTEVIERNTFAHYNFAVLFSTCQVCIGKVDEHVEKTTMLSRPELTELLYTKEAFIH